MPFRSYPRETRALLGAQLIFNLGFYAVVPFLAGAMASEFGMTAAAIGIVLGARTFSQQGMFLIGGLLADRWGARRSILAGCLVRIAGYAVLLGAADFTLFLIGAVLTGVGGACSPRRWRRSCRMPTIPPARPAARRGAVRCSCGWRSSGR
ncbi:MFS transporter [Kocuria coralli]|uniref:MFS transporter n=1 Tax=Kocuria coralli TaxID=1461025 RepID=UPI00248421EE|nr:MFS transporter [Kocuria coralli]